MAEPYIAQISCFGCSFSPRNWAYCDGQLLPIAQYTALFSLVGTIYGGNGTTNFALPDMRGRSPMHWGSGPSGEITEIGEVEGTETLTLITSQLPAHNHSITSALNTVGHSDERTPGPGPTSYLGSSGAPQWAWNPSPPNMNAVAAVNAIGVTGSSQPHENRQPYLVLNLCIALQGVFPSRN